MTKLKLGSLQDLKPVKLTVELPADLFADLVAYGAVLGRDTEAGAAPIEPVRLVAPMLRHFIANDRGFARARRAARVSSSGG